MPRGKNYVNQNKGMTLVAASAGNGSKKNHNTAKMKKSTVVEMCFFGNGCTRKGCIYRHPTTMANNYNSNPTASSSFSPSSSAGPASLDKKSEAPPCKPFLAGMCSFNAATCHKRHVTDPVERQRYLDKYRQTPCRHGVHCKQKETGGCLFNHDAHFILDNSVAGTASAAPAVQRSLNVSSGITTLPDPLLVAAQSMAQLQRMQQHHHQQQQTSFATSSTLNATNPVVCQPTAVPGTSLRVAMPTGLMMMQKASSTSAASISSPAPVLNTSNLSAANGDRRINGVNTMSSDSLVTPTRYRPTATNNSNTDHHGPYVDFRGNGRFPPSSSSTSSLSSNHLHQRNQLNNMITAPAEISSNTSMAVMAPRQQLQQHQQLQQLQQLQHPHQLQQSQQLQQLQQLQHPHQLQQLQHHQPLQSLQQPIQSQHSLVQGSIYDSTVFPPLVSSFTSTTNHNSPPPVRAEHSHYYHDRTPTSTIANSSSTSYETIANATKTSTTFNVNAREFVPGRW